MSSKKKQIRKVFREDCWKRDKYTCVMCGKKFSPQNAEGLLDAHHITPRELLPNGGYVKANGISLCEEKCHIKAENYLKGNITEENKDFNPENLYKKIGSCYDDAFKESSEKLS